MTVREPEALRWHDDGHQLWLQLVKSELSIATVMCPGDGACKVRQAECVVRFFIDRFGLECNVGVCPPAEYLDIAWALVGDPDELDLAQVWIIPTSDDVYASWRAAQENN